MKLSSILGLNARSQSFTYLYNTPRGKRIASSKLLTDKILSQHGVPVPKLFEKFGNPNKVLEFDWNSLPASFALKPAKGMGGEGIIVVRGKAKDGNGWITSQKKRVAIDDLQLHALDILEGAFSIGNVPDRAFIQEYVGRHKAFRRFAYRGTPDIRVIVFNKVPVMAMLRLPTRESGGRANLHQGAIGVGIDIATGITTYAIWHGEYIKYKPGTKRKLHGIKIPQWNSILELAVRCQEVSGLGYLGVDIVLHPDKGPMVLELNANPGLQIQLANWAGLKKRLERIEDLEVRDFEHGIRFAKALFAGRFTDRVAAKDGIKTINVWEVVKVVSSKKQRVEVVVKVDTGAWRTSIDRELANKLGLLHKENILWSKPVRSGLGKEDRQVIGLTFYLAGRKIDTIASVANRKTLRSQIIIGRRDLAGFLISSARKDPTADWYRKLWTKRT